MTKPETMPLFIAIAPYGVFLQFCVKCGHEDFILIEDNTYLACAKCGAKIAKWNAEYTAKLESVRCCDNCTMH